MEAKLHNYNSLSSDESCSGKLPYVFMFYQLLIFFVVEHAVFF